MKKIIISLIILGIVIFGIFVFRKEDQNNNGLTKITLA